MNRRVVLLALCVGLLLVGTASAWYDYGWDYRKEFTINNTGSNLTDYQVMFTVNRSTGSDSGFTVYLDSKCEADYDDIRFVGDDDTTAWDYWIESSSSTVATIWVEVPSIPNSTAYGSTTGYLYYGNSGASAVSDGDNTFIFFDHFENPSSSLNTTKWDNMAGSGVSVSGGVLTCTASSDTSYGVESKNTDLGVNISIRAKIYPFHPKSTTYLEGLYARQGPTTPYQNALYFSHVDSAYSGKYLSRNGGSVTTESVTGLGGAGWYIPEGRMDSSSIKWSLNDANPVTISTNYYPTSSALRIVSYASGAKISTDWIFVRKYTSTEPTVSAWGSEENAPLVSISVDFSGLPTSGYVPLLVSFSDLSTAQNCTINTWQWSFGDSSVNSTLQNPQHQYITSGLYDVILTARNTTLGATNTTTKTGYINVTVNVDAPVADFTVTETCGETTDTFYFIDFSTGGGLYAWNWSFGDGAYSELRNPTHQYAGNGTYDVNLTVWGAYGVDSLLRSNLITIPCGAPTPTPTATVTVTPTGTPGNVTEGNITYIYAPDQDYVPFPIWLAIVIVSIALFGHSIIFLRNSDLTAMMAAVFAFISAWLSNMIGYIDVQVTSFAEEIVISPVIQAVHPPWLVYTMLLFALVSVVNIFAAIYKVYLKPTPWNEIYNRKLPKWRNR